jgi:uncharacterized protein (TIGR00255 family)
MDRVRQEVVLHGMRIDVAEELSRLAVHLDELERILQAGGAVGKAAGLPDAGTQSRSQHAGLQVGANVDLANAAVELKLLIEQMREQVQNIE